MKRRERSSMRCRGWMPEKYDRRSLHRALTDDIEALTDIWYQIRDIS